MAKRASSGHKLGQLVGDWFEQYFSLPLLRQVAGELELYLDNRFVSRPLRGGEKVIWRDVDGNAVDYDFVLELGGSDEERGVPVAFVECFWRRGARHSKDKARDDSGKLRPMRATYPTARFLGILAAGDFTQPARSLVLSQEIDLFYVPKDKVVSAFAENGLDIDYPDQIEEGHKEQIVIEVEAKFSEKKKGNIARSLVGLLGRATVDSYIDRVRSKLSALPQQICLVLRQDSAPIVFEVIMAATEFLENPTFSMDDPTESYLYQVTYSDGSEFESMVGSVDELRTLHGHISDLAEHMNHLSGKSSPPQNI